MRLIDRYLLRELFVPLGYCLGGFLIFYVAFDLIASLNKFQEHHLLLRDVMELYAVRIPSILVFILPISLLLALLYALTNHSRHHELTAIRAAGISLWRLCAPYLIVGFLLSLVAFAMNEFWVPDSQDREERIMERRLRSGVSPDVDQQSNVMLANNRDHRIWKIGVYDFNTDVMLYPEVFWKIDGTNWHLLARRAERNSGVWTFYGTTSIFTNEVTDWKSLAAKLRHPANNISIYINEKLSPATLALLASYSDAPNAELQRALLADLNALLHGEPLYDARRFYGIKLSEDTANLIAQKPTGTDLVELNHLLLCDAFPEELSRNSLYTVTLYKGDPGVGYQVRFLDTNILAMPYLTEGPREFANEIRFNNRFRQIGIASPDIPIADLVSYLDVHPDLDPKYRTSLRTQLHGRIASPWKCLVVVLIAIPFGAASGRRNVFFGVAGSIIICFAYFILLQLGLALGTGGFIPAWIAAWLPNVIFGITGFWLITRVQ